MRGAGTDGPVVAMKPGNAGGAKGPRGVANQHGRSPGPRQGRWLEWKSRMRRESRVRFCEGGG
jgi:hypothetical protein